MVVKNKKKQVYDFSKKQRFIAAFLMLSIINQVIFPSVAMALTGGPSAVDFAGFSSVENTGLINESSGHFNYSIPILEIDGYSMALSYNSHKTVETESSWVGDWSLSPGQLSRNKVGYADDFNNVVVEKYNKARANHTVGLMYSKGLEFFSTELTNNAALNVGVRYNNYKGFSFVKGFSKSAFNGLANLNYSHTGGESSWDVTLDPSAILNAYASNLLNKNLKASQNRLLDAAAKPGLSELIKAVEKASKDQNRLKKLKKAVAIGSEFISTSIPLGRSSSVSQFNDYWGFTSSLYVNLAKNFPATPIPLGFSNKLTGSYTYQKNVELNEDNVFGYLYTSNATKNTDKMDYHVDNDHPFDNRNKFLGTPVSGADYYSVSGDGLQGTFRGHQKYAGQFRPQFQTSEIFGGAGGFNFGWGTNNLSAGPMFGVSSSILKISKWKINENTSDQFASNEEDESMFFRFSGEMAGEMGYNEGDDIKTASLVGGGIIGGKVYKPTFTNRKFHLNEGYRVPRSSYIAFRTNKEISEGNTFKYAERYAGSAYGDTSQNALADFLDRSEPILADQIGEFQITNKDGVVYNYGLPVFGRNEADLYFDADETAFSKNNFTKDISEQNDENIQTKVGEVSATPYAVSYLITEIKSPNYSSYADIGNKINFYYSKFHGSKLKSEKNNDWYSWRAPYTGLLSVKGDLSTNKDDIGSFRFGEKEIYNLKEIKSRTKVIRFVTEDRNDAIESADYYTAAADSNAIGEKRLQRLKEIKEYAISSDGTETLTKTTHFEYYPYDEGLCQGLPNYLGDDNTTRYLGKLTLRKVWVEFNGIKNTRISPYIFEHEYMKSGDYPQNVREKYPEITAHGDAFSALDQNPNYSPYRIDAWGFNQLNGADRYFNMQSWVNQNQVSPTEVFDPAAWLLKRIKLPTGGEIQVQYEQADYQYVQDKVAHVLVSLKPNQDDYMFRRSSFELDLDKMGITTKTEKEEVVKYINRMYKDGKQKMYFKFLYRLVNDDKDPEITDCNASYVSGFVPISHAQYDGVSENVFIHLNNGAGCNASLPGEICEDYVRTAKNGNIQINGRCGEFKDNMMIDLGSSAKEKVYQLVNWVSTVTSNANDNYCKTLNEELSYLRIPMVNKVVKGGGVRVKNLLLYDEGLETGDAVLYGTTYDYKVYDSNLEANISSGVATNLPSGCIDENPFYQMIDRDKQKIFFNLISLSDNACGALYGQDLSQSAGPIASSLMPGPSITYSKVTSHNIHNGETSTGYVVKEFHTFKDHPITVEYSDINETSPDWIYLPLVFINIVVNNVFKSQGFKITKPGFNGVPKSDKVFSGDPLNGGIETASVQYEYLDYKKGEQTTLVGENETLTKGYPGKEEELVMDSRNVADLHYSATYRTDLNLDWLPFAIWGSPSVGVIVNMEERKIKTHTSTKIVSYPAVGIRTITKSRGVESISETVAFDRYTGDPVLTRNYDGFDGIKNINGNQNEHNGAYESFAYKASHHYPEVGPKYLSEGRKIKTDLSKVTYDYSYVTEKEAYIFIDRLVPNAGSDLKWLSEGDLLKINEYNFGTSLHQTVTKISNDTIYLHPDRLFSYPISFQNVDFEILKSGKKNILGASVGNVTTYGVKSNFSNLTEALNSPVYALKDSTFPRYSPTNVIQASASTLRSEVNTAYTHENIFKAYTGHIGPWRPSEYQKGRAGIWSAHKSYVYKNDIVQANGSSSERIHNQAGVFNSFEEFNWINPELNSTNWINLTEVTSHDPSGHVTEEKNAIGIYSSALYGYNEQVATMVVNNANEAAIFFDSFESIYNDYRSSAVGLIFENGTRLEGDINDVHAQEGHCGKYSLNLTNHPITLFNTHQLSGGNSFEKGMFVKFWVKTDANPIVDVNNKSQKVYSDIKVEVVTDVATTVINPKVVARTGEWTLCEARLNPDLFQNISQFKLTLSNLGNGSNYYLIDDLIAYPIDAQAQSYVYDVATLRLLSSMDAQHFPVHYIYNAEGKLVSKKIETEEGIKTIQQTNYNTKGEAR